MMFFFLFNIFDAYRQATLLNYGYAAGTQRAEAAGESRSMALIPGVVLVAMRVQHGWRYRAASRDS